MGDSPELPLDKLRLYMNVARKEGAAISKREATKRQQLATREVFPNM